jgi:hypothetical protein
MKEINREIDNAFNTLIHRHKIGSRNMYFELYKEILDFDERHIETLNKLREKLKYDIDLAVGDKLEDERK